MQNNKIAVHLSRKSDSNYYIVLKITDYKHSLIQVCIAKLDREKKKSEKILTELFYFAIRPHCLIKNLS